MFTIKEISKLSGITVRALHYYDEIGLFKPDRLSEAGYRLYNEENIIKLQEILFFKELNFELKDIKKILEDKNYDRREAMKMQREVLKKKRERLDKLINIIDSNMNNEFVVGIEEFSMEEINIMQEKYKKEVEEKWGNTKEFKEYESKKYSDKENKKFKGEIEEYFKKFSSVMGKGADSKEAQDLVKGWKEYINKNFYTCSNEMLKNLGEMYIADERFKSNIDKEAEGLAEFINEAIKIHCM